MRTNRFDRVIAATLTFVMTCLMVSPGIAAANASTSEGTKKAPDSQKPLDGVRRNTKEAISNRDGRNDFSADELEQMRTVLLELVDANQLIASMFQVPNTPGKKVGNDDLTAEFDLARSQVVGLSANELTVYRRGLDPVKIHEKLVASVARLNESNARRGLRSSQITSTPTLPGISYFCNGTTPSTPMPVAPVDPQALSTADDVYFVAEGVRDIAQDGCNEVIVILGEGGNARALCLITDAIYLAAKVVNQKLHFCDNDYTASVVKANFDRLGHIHGDLEASVTNDNTNKDTIVNNDNANKTTIVNNDNANRDTIVNNDNSNTVAINNAITAALTSIIGNANANKDEVRNLLLRTQIEADLATADGAAFVALYETPSTVCMPALNPFGLSQVGIPTPTQCGLLDLVRAIVRQTIANVGARTNAQSFFNAAETFRAAGRYKEAYDSYRKAYKAAGK